MNEASTSSKPKSLSLLSPEVQGFLLSQVWRDLFALYTKGDEVRVELSPELRKIEWALLRGHTNYDESSPKISTSLFWLMLREFAREEGLEHSTFGFAHAADAVFANLSESFGAAVLKINTAKNEEDAKEAAKAACAMFKRALDGIVKSKFPQRARGSGDVIPKEVLAIWTAQGLCQHLRRLPTKAEVRQKLEAIGVIYAEGKSKDVEGKWRDLFGRSGLFQLPD
jgi:hypothetical protein